MIELETSRVATTMGGVASGLMAATLLNPAAAPMHQPQVQSFPAVVVYPAAPNTYGQYASLFISARLPLTEGMPSLVSFYADLLAKQERLGKEFEEVLFDNLWDLYAR